MTETAIAIHKHVEKKPSRTRKKTILSVSRTRTVPAARNDNLVRWLHGLRYAGCCDEHGPEHMVQRSARSNWYTVGSMGHGGCDPGVELGGGYFSFGANALRGVAFRMNWFKKRGEIDCAVNDEVTTLFFGIGCEVQVQVQVQPTVLDNLFTAVFVPENWSAAC